MLWRKYAVFTVRFHGIILTVIYYTYWVNIVAAKFWELKKLYLLAIKKIFFFLSKLNFIYDEEKYYEKVTVTIY